MTQFNSLLLAIDLAATRREQALAELQKQRQAHAFAQGQMDQLQQYATETELRWTQGAQRGTTPELLHHHYQFMARLQQAVSLQQGALLASSGRLENAQQKVLVEEFRLASLKQLLSRRQSELAKLHQRQDQKQMDEFAAMQTMRQLRQKLENSHEC